MNLCKNKLLVEGVWASEMKSEICLNPKPHQNTKQPSKTGHIHNLHIQLMIYEDWLTVN